MELRQTIEMRRSVRRLRQDPVADELLNAVLEAGRWAPSWGNTQCWRFVVVRDASIRAIVAETISPRNPATAALQNAPVIIVVCGQMGRAGFKSGEPRTDKGDWYMFDTALATQNMMLAAHALGLGTVPIGVFDNRKVAELLGIPQNIAVILLLPLGYPAEEPNAPWRESLAKITHLDRYEER